MQGDDPGAGGAEHCTHIVGGSGQGEHHSVAASQAGSLQSTGCATLGGCALTCCDGPNLGQISPPRLAASMLYRLRPLLLGDELWLLPANPSADGEVDTLGVVYSRWSSPRLRSSAW